MTLTLNNLVGKVVRFFAGLVESKHAKDNRDIEVVEKAMLGMEQIPLKVTHRFAPGVYMRELLMPAGTFVIGHEHKTEHLNIMLTGKARVVVDGVIKEMVAPCVVSSQPGTRKAAYIDQDVRWLTVHPTDETDVDKLEEQLIVKSPSFLSHEKAMKDIRKLELAQSHATQNH